MALIASVLVLSAEPGNSNTQASGASAPILVGANRIIAINANADINIAFGNSAIAATATSFRVPANSTFTFCTSPETAYMSIFGTAATYWWAYLSKF